MQRVEFDLDMNSFIPSTCGSLKQTIDALEQKCDEYSKQIESISQSLDAERRKSARLRENNASSITSSSTTNNYAIESPMIVLKSIITADNSSSGRSSHTSSASEPDHEEVSRSSFLIHDHKRSPKSDKTPRKSLPFSNST